MAQTQLAATTFDNFVRGFGVVELPADGLRVVTRLTESDPAALEEGVAMRFTVVPLGPGTVTWAFERA